MTCLCSKERTSFNSFAPVEISLCVRLKDVQIFKTLAQRTACPAGGCLCVCLHAAARETLLFSLGDKHHQCGPGKQPGDSRRGPGPGVGDLENH